MAKDRLEFARVAPAEEIAGYLASLATGLKRGQVSVESGEQTLRLAPAPELTLELRVSQKERKGKIEIEIGWKRVPVAPTAELRIEVGRARPRVAES
jgi:amphi-Trp domain-containing protein